MTPAKLSPTYTLSVNGVPRDIFLSFALLNRLTEIVGDPQNVVLVLTEPTVREVFLKELLAVRNTAGRAEGPLLELDEYEVELEEVSGLLDWSCEHILDFTLGVLEKAQALQARSLHRVQKIQASSVSTPLGQAT